MYRNCVKRLLDIILSSAALVVLAIPMIIFAVIIKLEDRGPIFFRQKRFGIHKKFFKIYKFRSMKVSTPRDIPSHMLENPEQYILRCGHWMRKYSIDELPQIINIFKGDMSFVGPRPALWNQDDLIAERDKYGANDVKPGLTGWAQINGRDSLEIPTKAKLDGEYTAKLSFPFDVKCFFLSIISVFTRNGVVEGGTGALNKAEEQE